jgi:pimeloyl-ACP methyl ester carboxylesterase
MAQALLDIRKSTTGRIINLEWQRIQLLLGASISASLAERTAARLFATPRRIPRPESENELLARARAFRVDGLAAWRWGSGPPVLLVHGWEGRGAQLGAFVEPLVARGFSVVAFDAPAHGASPGIMATVSDFADAVTRVSDRLGGAHAIVAHSLGGLGALLALRRGARTQGLALVAPPSPGQRLRAFRDAIDVPAAILNGMKRRIERRVGAAFDDVEAPNLARQLPVKGLVVNDRRDAEAPLWIAEQTAAAWPLARLHVTEGLGHRRILKDRAVTEVVAEFVASTWQPPAPKRAG